MKCANAGTALALLCSAANSQATDQRLDFEAASVRPVRPTIGMPREMMGCFVGPGSSGPARNTRNTWA